MYEYLSESMKEVRIYNTVIMRTPVERRTSEMQGTRAAVGAGVVTTEEELEHTHHLSSGDAIKKHIKIGQLRNYLPLANFSPAGKKTNKNGPHLPSAACASTSWCPLPCRR